MRYVPSLPPLPSVKEKEEEGPHPLIAVRPAKPVEPRTRVPQVIQPFRPKARAEEAVGGPTAVRVERRVASDRREESRRQQRGQPFLDTRSKVERRRQRRRSGDVATTLDEEG